MKITDEYGIERNVSVLKFIVNAFAVLLSSFERHYADDDHAAFARARVEMKAIKRRGRTWVR